MKTLKKIFVAFVLALLFLSTEPVKAQCAMCAANAETSHNSGNNKADGLNKGIMVLLAAPYLAVAVVGFIWYKRFRRKNIALNMRNEKLNLN
ncbi:hypothetical protein [Mucilaginibacter arboris]|uniref:CcmD family protein n=1 Tax=Mucilaginibacter arboris TaxID=2682090 RepID=A0A7K1SUW9_9SPHI|nr:hypothetical protein [Mucilaginibacter arboris]MVN21139.1 hypothetical protein [Mucilaginibacter arboris]